MIMCCIYFLNFPVHFLSFLSDPSLDDSGAVSLNTDDKQDVEKMDKHKKKKGSVNKGPKPNYDEGGGNSSFI